MVRVLLLASVLLLGLSACTMPGTSYEAFISPCHAKAMALPPGTCLQGR